MREIKLVSILSLLTFCFIMTSFGQSSEKPIENKWKSIEQKIEKGEVKSVVKDLELFQKQAKKDKEEGYELLSMMKLYELKSYQEESNELKVYKELEDEIKNAKGVRKAFLLSLQASLLVSYKSYDNLNLEDRTSGAGSGDVEQWSAKEIDAKIEELYLASLADEQLLFSTDLKKYLPLIEKGENTNNLRPTLFDLLAHKALNYFESENEFSSDVRGGNLRKKFEQSVELLPAKQFMEVDFIQDGKNQSVPLSIYQRLLKLHFQKNEDAFVDVDILRLESAYNESSLKEKLQKYKNALEEIAKKYPQSLATSKALFLVAQLSYYEAQGSNTSKDKIKLTEVVKVLDHIMRDYPETEGYSLARNLKSEIEKAELTFELAGVNTPNKPFLLSVTYKNVAKVYLKIVPWDGKLAINNYSKERLIALNKAKTLTSWEQKLPSSEDYNQHRTEVKVDELPIGKYVLIVSTDPEFIDNGKSLIVGRVFHVSNISYVAKHTSFFVADRESGQPLVNADVNLWKYDNSSKSSKLEKSIRTNSQGLAHFSGELNNGYKVTIVHGKDTLNLKQNSHYFSSNTRSNETSTRIAFYTDRALYRPGQIVHFKGILLGDRTSIHGKRLTVQLENLQTDSKDSLELVTNKYGSIYGTFVLPKEGSSTGLFELSLSGGYFPDQKTIQVEEYKRPTFEVKLDSLKGEYKLNDTLKMSGLAKAYAGNVVPNGEVAYRVVRQPRWFHRSYWGSQSQGSTPITEGFTKTDENGAFSFEFTALPDLSNDHFSTPIFDYKIVVDVTDANGETRSEEKVISISEKSFFLSADVPKESKSDWSGFKLKVMTIGNVNLERPVSLQITELLAPTQLKRERLWIAPDQFVLSEEEFTKDFPTDIYKGESDELIKGNIVLTGNGISNVKGNWPFDTSRSLPNGLYEVEIKVEGESAQNWRLEINDGKQILSPKVLWVSAPNEVKINSISEITIGTTVPQLHVVELIEAANSDASKPHVLEVSNGIIKRPIQLSTQSKALYAAIYNNRLYTYEKEIVAIDEVKTLQVQLSTFRNKIEPNSEESWTLTVKNSQGQPVAAEVLASMYDASLDQFVKHQWIAPRTSKEYYFKGPWSFGENFRKYGGFNLAYMNYEFDGYNKSYDLLREMMIGRLLYESVNLMEIPPPMKDARVAVPFGVQTEFRKSAVTGSVAVAKEKAEELPPIKLRTNFQETAFFYPSIETDSKGETAIKFTIPESLTRWKFQAIAHTENLAAGYTTDNIIAQKELMVQPLLPRFMREGDQISIPTKVVNLSEKTLDGQVSLTLIDTSTGEILNDSFIEGAALQPFSIVAGKESVHTYKLSIPDGYISPISIRIVAQSSGKSDGEENVIPVLSRKQLITESLTFSIGNEPKKELVFDNLRKNSTKATVQNQHLTVELTANPVWNVIDALPYLVEYPYECSEQLWNRYVGNELSAYIIQKYPQVENYLQDIKQKGNSQSPLLANPELKGILLEETPWLLEAKSEAEQQQNLLTLFDLKESASRSKKALDKLTENQNEDGGFPWMKGGYSSEYITQYVLSGVGHLRQLMPYQTPELEDIVETAIRFLDQGISRRYARLKNQKQATKQTPAIASDELYQLYVRSLFDDISIDSSSQKAYDYYQKQYASNWVQQPIYSKALIALVAHRSGNTKLAKQITTHLKETAIVSSELGTYWKNNTLYSRSLRQGDIEQQALLAEVFSEVPNDTDILNGIKKWLVLNKQTNRWESTKATAEACYAMLLYGGNDWLQAPAQLKATLGNWIVETPKESTKGYIKQSLQGQDIAVNKSTITIEKNPASGFSTGAIHWQYLDDMATVAAAGQPVKIVKELFIQKATEKGLQLQKIDNKESIKVGDLVKVRIVLETDRDLEFVHMKDLRGAGFEPTNVLSEYKFQGGLGYYQSTRDVATHFFFDQILKGKYVFEYDLRAFHSGDFSMGTTSLECMYAPEFRGNSAGGKVAIVEK